MSTVITKEQAKQITKGRTPLVPIEYETAINALTECVTLDEAKYWSDKADALAAWAKIYHSNEAERKAKQLKLHAYRRMGELATELRPPKAKQKGPTSLLQEMGLSQTQARSARYLGGLTPKSFKKLIDVDEPMGPSTVYTRAHEKDPLWSRFCVASMALRAFLNENSPAKVADLASSLGPREVVTLRKLATDLSEQLDDLLARAEKKFKALPDWAQHGEQ